ncbi:hypothetical protein ACLKA6_000417 [Drosophila palustris]
MDSAPAGSQNELMMPMLANGSYLASKLPKATRFDAGRPTPELPLSGSESDYDSSLTMSTNSISQISPGGNDDSKFMNVMTRFAEFTAKRASNTVIEESISNDEKDFLAVLDRVPAFAPGAGLTGLREITALVKTVTNNFKIKNIGSSSTRLTVEDGKTYREAQNLFQANEILYNSWQPKEERSDTDKQDISDALDHKLSPPRVNVWDISSPDHPAHASSRPLHQPDHVSLSVDQDPSLWPALGYPVPSGASSRPLSTAASSSSSGVSVLHQPAQERLLQQILSLQAAQLKDAHAQSSSVEKLLSRLDQMMALLMQVMGKVMSLLPGQPVSASVPQSVAQPAFPTSSCVHHD